jgi:hypothetical protein
MNYVTGGMIQNNIAYDYATDINSSANWGGPIGMFFYHATNSTIQYNEVYNGHYTTIYGEAFDNDVADSNCIFQYNYSHNNSSGFFLICQGNSATIRYNISQNDGTGIFVDSISTSYPPTIYNNTIYIGSGSYTNITSNSIPGANFYNNIIYNLGNGGYADGASWSHNLFYGNHPSSEPSDTYKLTSDPQFVSAGSGGNGRNTLGGYQLQSGSSAIGSETLISNNGGLDFWGNSVSSSSAPNRGAYNGGGGEHRDGPR